MTIRTLFRLALLLVLLAAEAVVAAGPEAPLAQKTYSGEFVRNNQDQYEAYLRDLQTLWQRCCADPKLDYPDVNAVTCEHGDLFYNRFWQITGQKKRPSDGGLKALFSTKVASYPYCEVPAKDGAGCALWGIRWYLNANRSGGIGGGAALLDSGRCKITANAVKFNFEGYGRVAYREYRAGTGGNDRIRETQLLGSGKPLKLRARVNGPANMARYTAVWSAESGSVSGRGNFVRRDGAWYAEAALTVPAEPAHVWLDAQLGEHRYPVVVDARVAGHPPPLDRLQLDQDGRTLGVGETLHMFYPTDGKVTALTLGSQAVLINGQVVANWAAQGIEEPSMVVEDATLATLTSPSGVEEGVHYLGPRHLGETRLIVSYPQSVVYARPQTIYESYPVRVHQLTLTRVFAGNGNSLLRLLARGPDPGSSTVKWDGGSAGFRREQGYWFVDIPDQGVSQLRVVNPAGQELAVLEVAGRAPDAAAEIRLIPPAAPNYTVFKEIPMPASEPDLAGWAISSGFCNQATAGKLPKAMSTGSDGAQFQSLLQQARYMCENKEQLEQNQAEIRRIVPQINSLIRDLAKGGNELVGLEDDDIAVGASIKGLSPRWSTRAYCRWSLENGGASQLAYSYTPVQRVDTGSGACFNRVTNLIKGFTPGLRVAVELIVGL